MFEAEVEMEQRSSILPLLLMLCLAAAIVGLVGYVVLQVREQSPLKAQQANPVVAAALAAQGPAVIHFRTGVLKTSGDEKPGDPNYRLLEKAGIVKVAKASGGSVVVTLTPAGDHLLAGIPGLKKEKKDSGFSYKAPLAERQLVSIGAIEMNR